MSGTRLTEPQRKALEAAAAGKLTWSRPVMRSGGYAMRHDGGGWSLVRESTANALIKRGLLVEPRAKLGDWSSMPVQITEQGRAALSRPEVSR